jgi:hypothetical protein
VKRFQFGHVCFFQCPAFTPQSVQSLDRACEIISIRIKLSRLADPFNDVRRRVIESRRKTVPKYLNLRQKGIKRSSSISMSSISATDDSCPGLGKCMASVFESSF